MRSSVSNISERGVEWEREREIVNPERNWIGVIIKYSEGGGEMIDAPLCSHTLITTQLLLLFFFFLKLNV